MIGIPTNLGYIVLFLLIFGESAGMPLPGETSLIAASALAAQGHLSLPLVLVAALSAAVLGDNLGYLIGRHAGYRVLTARGPFAAHRARLLTKGETFFDHHGAMAVCLGRWTPVLRVTAALLAGTHRMPWRRFLIWNTVGGAGWVLTIGLTVFVLGGHAPGGILGIGIALTALGLATLALRIAYRRTRRRGVTAGRGSQQLGTRLDDRVARALRAGNMMITAGRRGNVPESDPRRVQVRAVVVGFGLLALVGLAWMVVT